MEELSNYYGSKINKSFVIKVLSKRKNNSKINKFEI